MSEPVRCDVLLAGGGLANGLIAWRLRQQRPGLRLLLVERGATLGGRHTWSFHETDLTPAQNAWISPLVDCSWPGQQVRFPGLRRRLRAGYRSIRSDGFHRELAALLGSSAWLGRGVRELHASGASLEDGTRIEADCVIDGRGFAPGPWLRMGVQRFFGLDVELTRPHDLEVPVLMDAEVEQTGGFRFFYLLPWSRRRLLIEETLYEDRPAADPEVSRQAILTYARERGLEIGSVAGEEKGVLPIPLAGEIGAAWSDLPDGVAAAGMRGGFFQATTGYSLPEAVRVADALAGRARLDGPDVAAWLREHALRHWRDQRFLRLLNRLLFEAASPAQRRAVLARFYRLPEGLIERFYAGRLRLTDRIRLLVGKPPVPIGRALRCLPERSPRGRGSERTQQPTREENRP